MKTNPSTLVYRVFLKLIHTIRTHTRNSVTQWRKFFNFFLPLKLKLFNLYSLYDINVKLKTTWHFEENSHFNRCIISFSPNFCPLIYKFIWEIWTKYYEVLFITTMKYFYIYRNILKTNVKHSSSFYLKTVLIIIRYVRRQ